MYIYLDKQGIVREIINDEAIRQASSNVNEINVYFDGLSDYDIKDILATWQLPDGTITDEMEVATDAEEKEIPYDAERDLKCFEYYKAYPFYSFNIIDEALAQDGVVRLTLRFAQKNGEYIKVAGLICFEVEASVVKEDADISLAQYNYLIKAWAQTKSSLPLDGSESMQGDLQLGKHSVILNGKELKDYDGTLNYNGKDLADKSNVDALEADNVANKADISALKADNTANKANISALQRDNTANKFNIASLQSDNATNKNSIVGLQSQIDTINATQNVVDIVGTKAELNAYSTKNLLDNDKIEVLVDESQSGANTIYNWKSKKWVLIGEKAVSYSKSEADAKFALKTKVDGIEGDLTSLKADNTKNKNDISALGQNLSTMNDTLFSVKEEVNGNVADIEKKQDALVSGTNIKTINGQSILGSGDIPIGGGSATVPQLWHHSVDINGEAESGTGKPYNILIDVYNTSGAVLTKDTLPAAINLKFYSAVGFVSTSKGVGETYQFFIANGVWTITYHLPNSDDFQTLVIDATSDSLSVQDSPDRIF